MANQNLSQFGEKLFVADADHTFIWDSAALISKRVSRNSWLNSGTLTSDAPVTISQTWNNAAVAFTGLKFNAAGTSDANSSSGSLLADFQLNGGSLFKVQKNGRTTFSTSTGVIFKINEVSGSISGDSSNSFGTVFINGDQAGGGASVVSLGGGGAEGVTCRSSGFFAFSSSGSNALHANRDTILLRDGAANTLALRNGASAQTFNVYGTYTSITDYRRLTISCDNTTGNATITANKGSATTGGNGQLSIGVINPGGTFSRLVFSDTRPLLQFNTGNVNLPNNSNYTISSKFNIPDNQVGMGFQVFETLTSGVHNVGFGMRALAGPTTANYCISLGFEAGYKIANNSLNDVCNDSIFIGRDTRPLNSNETNQIVIGHTAVGIGSNSVVLGNDSITKTALKGNVGIGTTSPTSKLQVSAGDVEVDTIAKGVILKSPDGTRYRVTVANGGTLSVAAV